VAIPFPGVFLLSASAPHGQCNFRKAPVDLNEDLLAPVKDRRDQPVLIPIDIEDYLYFWSPGLVTGCWVYAFYLAEGFHTVGTQAVNAIAGAPNARALLYAGEMASTRNLLESGEPQRRVHPLAH
jgi:hypothetical protein